MDHTFGPRGDAFWQSITARYELAPGELELLAETCRTLDVLVDLDLQIATTGPMTTGASGQPVVHPAVGEARGQRLALHRLLAAMNLPDADGETIRTARSIRGTTAARARWAIQARAGRTG